MNARSTENLQFSTRTAIVLLAIVVLIGAAIRLPGITLPFGHSMDGWTGAFYSCMARNCLELRTLVPYVNPSSADSNLIIYGNHPPSAAWTVSLSFLLLGQSELAARFPFLIFSLLSIVYIYRLGCRIGNNVSGLTAAICLATAPVAVVYGYQIEIVGSHVLLASLAATLAHFDFYEKNSKRNALRLGVWTLFLLWSDWPAAFLFFVLQVVTWIRRPLDRRYVVAWSCYGLGVLACMAVWLMSVDPKLAVSYFAEKIAQRTFQLQTDSQGLDEGQAFGLLDLLGRYIWLHWNLFGLAMTVPLAFWLVMTMRDKFKGHVIPMALIGFAMVFLTVGAQGHYQHDFWCHPLAAAYAIAISAVLTRLRLRPIHTVWLSLMIALGNLVIINHYRTHIIPARSGARIANTHHKIESLTSTIPDSDCVLITDRTQWPTLPYYLPRSFVAIDQNHGLETVENGVWNDADEWQRFLLTHRLLIPKDKSAQRQQWQSQFNLNRCRWVITHNGKKLFPNTDPVAVSGQWQLFDRQAHSSQLDVDIVQLAANPTDASPGNHAETGMSDSEELANDDFEPQSPQEAEFDHFGGRKVFEMLSIFVMLGLCVYCRRLDTGLIRRCSIIFRQISRRRKTAIVIAGIVGLSGSMMMSWLTSLP